LGRNRRFGLFGLQTHFFPLLTVGYEVCVCAIGGSGGDSVRRSRGGRRGWTLISPQNAWILDLIAAADIVFIEFPNLVLVQCKLCYFNLNGNIHEDMSSSGTARYYGVMQLQFTTITTKTAGLEASCRKGLVRSNSILLVTELQVI
jgi:hypothetical protein